MRLLAQCCACLHSKQVACVAVHQLDEHTSLALQAADRLEGKLLPHMGSHVQGLNIRHALARAGQHQQQCLCRVQALLAHYTGSSSSSSSSCGHVVHGSASSLAALVRRQVPGKAMYVGQRYGPLLCPACRHGCASCSS